MSDIKVLMADDEPEVLEIMAKKIAANGYKVVNACDGQDAWEKIQSESPDIIILDLMMPRMDGFSVLKNLRERPPSEKWQPVVIISALGETRDIDKGIELQADHYLIKPCMIEDILKAIRLMVALIPQHKSAQEMKNS